VAAHAAFVENDVDLLAGGTGKRGGGGEKEESQKMGFHGFACDDVRPDATLQRRWALADVIEDV
jgi:hypothetical protein